MPTDSGQDDGFDFVGPTLHPASHGGGNGGVSPQPSHPSHPQHPHPAPAQQQELYYPLWHPGKVQQGSSTVTINDLPAARVGDPIDCGSHVHTGSDDVHIGD